MDLQELAEYQRGQKWFEDRIPVNHIVDLPEGKKLEVMYAQCASVADKDSPSYVMLILPGGGYEFCSYREGRVIAQAFTRYGLNAAVLNYGVKIIQDVEKDHTGLGIRPMLETAWAIDELRHNEKLGLTNSKIVVCGFSAGGHLAASICTRFADPKLLSAYNFRGSVRPDGAVLSYPVISADPKLAHAGSFFVLTGSWQPEDWSEFSCEKLVDTNTPPAFIWHTAPDSTVSVNNSIVYAQAMWTHGCCAELHIYPHGEHGSSLSIDGLEPEGKFALSDSYRADWVERAVKFIRRFV